MDFLRLRQPDRIKAQIAYPAKVILGPIAAAAHREHLQQIKPPPPRYRLLDLRFALVLLFLRLARTVARASSP